MGIAAGIGVGQIANMVDEYAKFTAQLKLASQSQREYAAGYADVKRIAAQSTQGLQETGVLYARIANGTKELGIAQKQVAAITETVNLSLLVSGATASEAASAQLQLSQAFASGTLRGEEFNAVNEAAPRLMLALADGIGVPVGALKKMAEQGEITSKIMADVLPNALEKLRNEAKEVQTISGAFTVLRNSVMEFVGVQAQANGVVATISSSLTLFAQNLGLVAGAIGVVLAAKFVSWLSSIGSATVTATAGNRAFLASNLEVARSQATATAQASLLANARLAEIRTATLAATGNVQLALTTNALIPAQTRATVATAAHEAAMQRLVIAQRAASLGAAALGAATTAASRLVALTGGPIGFLITVLGGAALAFSHYGDKAKEAAEKAKGAVEQSTQEIVDGLNKQNEKLRERIELSKQAGKADAARQGGEAVEKLAALGSKINLELTAINQGLYGPYKDEGTARLRVVELQYEYTALSEAIDRVSASQKEIANGTRESQITEWFAQNGTKAQRLAAELKVLKERFGEIPPEMERLVREKYAEKDLGANALEQARKAAENYIESLKQQQATVSMNAEQQRMYAAAQAAAKAPTEDLKNQILQQAAATNEAIKSQENYEKSQESVARIQSEIADSRKDSISAASQEAEKNEQLAKTFGMTEAAIAALEVARLKEQLAQRSSLGLTLDEIEHLETLITLKERSAKAVADREELEQTKQFWEDIEKTAHDTFVSIADGGKNAFQRLKETAKNTFFDWLYQQTLKKWIINIQASTSGGGMSILDTFQQKGFSGLFDAGMNIFKGFSQGISTSLGGVISKLGSTFGSKAVQSFGSGISSSASAGGIAGAIVAGMMANDKFYSQGWRLEGQAGDIIKSQLSSMFNGSGIKSLSSIIKTSVSSFGKILSNSLKGNIFEAIKETLNLNNSSFKSFISGIGISNGLAPITAIMTASMSSFEKIVGKIGINNRFASLISGSAVFARAFGRKAPEIKEQGLKGTLSGSGFSGNSYAYILEKGGWFRSDKWSTQTAALEKEQQQYFSGTIQAMIGSVKAFGDVLGVQTSAIEGYSKSIQLKWTDNAEENEKMVADLFAGIGDELAVLLLPNIAQFQQSGETAAAALQRVVVGFQAVDAVLAALGTNSEQAFRAVGVASLEARERLVALAGGIDSFASQSQFYVNNFLTRAEQLEPIQRMVNDQLAALGYAGVKTGDQFKQVVNQLIASGALATEEGAKTYSSLMALAPAFQTVTDYLNELKEAAKETASNRLDSLSRAVDAQKDIVTKAYQSAMTELETQIDGVNDSISRTQELSEALKGAIGTVSSPTQAYAARQAAQAQIATALAIAKASGVLPSTDDLRDALSSLSRDSSGQFSTLADYQREVARTNNQLIELGGLTDDQLSVAERQLRALQDQKELARTTSENELLRLDSLVSFQQRQLNALTGVDDRVYSVAEAVRRVEEALDALRYAPPGASVGLPTSVVNPNPNLAQPSVPVVSMPQQYGTMGGSAAAMAQQTAINDRFANMEKAMNRTANAVTQLASQFDQASGGGNALLVETA
jgi:tape measure domain-containing protein